MVHNCSIETVWRRDRLDGTEGEPIGGDYL